MNLEQPSNQENLEKIDEDSLEREPSQEKLAEIGKNVLMEIKMTKKEIEKLEEKKKTIEESIPEGEDSKSNQDLQYIENVLPVFYSKLEALEGLAGQD